MAPDHQQEDPQPWHRFTYILRTGKWDMTISKRTCSHAAGSLTIWKQENATRPSARGLTAIKQDHLLPESRKMPQDHQQEDLQLSNRFAYFLSKGKCHKTISKRTCSHETGLLTSWEQENVTRPSIREPATRKQVHLLPECRKMPQNHQQEDLQLWNRFTYCLKAGKCHKIISKRTSCYETGSLAAWEQANAKRPSARGPAAMKPVLLTSWG